MHINMSTPTTTIVQNQLHDVNQEVSTTTIVATNNNEPIETATQANAKDQATSPFLNILDINENILTELPIDVNDLVSYGDEQVENV